MGRAWKGKGLESQHHTALVLNETLKNNEKHLQLRFYIAQWGVRLPILLWAMWRPSCQPRWFQPFHCVFYFRAGARELLEFPGWFAVVVMFVMHRAVSCPGAVIDNDGRPRMTKAYGLVQDFIDCFTLSAFRGSRPTRRQTLTRARIRHDRRCGTWGCVKCVLRLDERCIVWVYGSIRDEILPP